MAKDLFTTGAAAYELGVTPARVRQMIPSGKLKAQKIGRDLVIRKRDLDGEFTFGTGGYTPSAKIRDNPVKSLDLFAAAVAVLREESRITE